MDFKGQGEGGRRRLVGTREADDGDGGCIAPADDLGQQRRDLREVQQLMQGFSEELSKLNEALEVMAAYVERMRRSSGSRRAGSLH